MGIVGRGDTGLGDRTWPGACQSDCMQVAALSGPVFPRAVRAVVLGRAVVSSPTPRTGPRRRPGARRVRPPISLMVVTVAQAGFTFSDGHDFSVRIEHFG